jgi:hypothetical protein
MMPSADTPASDARLKLEYEAARELLKMQDATLANVRSRATNVLSTAALLTSIAVGVGLINTDPKRGATFPAEAGWALLAMTVGIGMLVLYVHWPVNPWTFGPSPVMMRELRADNADESRVIEEVTTRMIEDMCTQIHVIKRRQAAFRWSSVGLLADVAILFTVGLAH